MLSLLAAVLPETMLRAADDLDLPVLTIDGVQLDVADYGFGQRGDWLYSFRPGGGPSAPGGDERMFLVDACQSADRAWVLGVDDSGGPREATLEFPGVGLTSTVEFPGAQDADGQGPVPFLGELDLPCHQLHPPRTGRLPVLAGVATYDGLGRCSGFDAPIEFSESKRGRGYDTYTMRGDPNRVVQTNPLIATDTSKIFDEVHIIMIPDPDRSSGIVGVAVGGPQGAMPKGKKLDRVLGALFADQSQDLAEALLQRADAGKVPTRLLKGLKAKGNVCTYAVDIDLDAAADDPAVGQLSDRLTFQEDLIAPTIDRFRVDIDWADGVVGTVPPVRLFGEAGSAAGTELDSWFFVPTTPDLFSSDLLVKVLDGCSYNDHFWVFAAGATQLEYTVTVTDARTGITRSLGSSSEPFQPVVDTEAFATCP